MSRDICDVVARSVYTRQESRKPKAPSGKGPTGVAKAEVDTTMPTPTRGPGQSVTPLNGEVIASGLID